MDKGMDRKKMMRMARLMDLIEKCEARRENYRIRSEEGEAKSFYLGARVAIEDVLIDLRELAGGRT